MNNGSWDEKEDWTDKCPSVVSNLFGVFISKLDIRFKLMAADPNRRIAITHKQKMLRTNKTIVTTALKKLFESKQLEPKVENCETVDSIKGDQQGCI